MCWKRTANAIFIITTSMWSISPSGFMVRGAGRKLDGENFEKRLMPGRGTGMQTSKSRLPRASDEVLMQSIPARSESHRYQRPVQAVRDDK